MIKPMIIKLMKQSCSQATFPDPNSVLCGYSVAAGWTSGEIAVFAQSEKGDWSMANPGSRSFMAHDGCEVPIRIKSKLETRDSKPRTRSQKIEIRKPKLHLVSCKSLHLKPTAWPQHESKTATLAPICMLTSVSPMC